MARILTKSGVRISALPDARPFTDERYVQKLGDRGFNADTRERGDFLSVRVERAHLLETTLSERVFWVPVADAHCVYHEGRGEFQVFGGPNSPQVAQWFLAGLEADERADLMADLKRE